MKIIKHGIYYKENRKIKCNCGCEFEYEIEDIKKDNTLAYISNPPLIQEYILCPECNARINLSKTYTHSITTNF